MSVSYTTTDLVARIRRTTQMSDQNLKLSDAEILQIADECIQSRLWPELRRIVEEYATTHAYVTFDPTSLTQSYLMRLPPRASGSTIVSVYQVSAASGNANNIREIPRIDISEAQRYGDPNFGAQIEGTHPRYYALTGDFIKIVPAASESLTLRVLYERRPSRLCAVADSAQIVSWSEITNVFTVGSIPVGFAEGADADLVRASQQATDPLVIDAEIVDLSAPDEIELDFDDTIVGAQTVYATVSPGDFICEAGTTCVFPLPDNWYSICVLAAASDVLQQAGYGAESTALVPQIESKIQLATQHNASRVRKQPKATFDRDSPLRTGGWGYGNGGWWNNGGGF